MVQRAITFRIPASQRELLGAGQAVHSNPLCRHAHPREAVEKLLGLAVGVSSASTSSRMSDSAPLIWPEAQVVTFGHWDFSSG
jgi:hypothetical protein